MAAKAPASNPDLEAQEYLHHSTDDILGCRGQGHRWPKLRPGTRLPRGLKVEGPWREGVMELVMTCLDCGMVRRLVTGPHGELNLPASYTYTQPEGYRAPKGSHVTRRQCLEETWRRSRDTLTALASERKRALEAAGALVR